MQNYYEALKKTDPKQIALLKAASDEGKKAVHQFKDFYRVFSSEKNRGDVRALYREDAYFRDGFREVRGIDDIEKYFVRSTEAFWNAPSTSRMSLFMKAIIISAGS
jgi:hypothetical protein